MCTILNIHTQGTVGEIAVIGNSAVPGGSLLCNGASYPTASYPVLFALIGYNFGGSGANFNVPELRGYFIRGPDYIDSAKGAASRDPNAATRTAMNTGGNVGSASANTTGSVQANDTAKNNLSVTNTIALTSGTLSLSATTVNFVLYGAGVGGSFSGLIAQTKNVVSLAASAVSSVAGALSEPGHHHTFSGTIAKSGSVTLGTGDAETRPINAYLNCVICYK